MIAALVIALNLAQLWRDTNSHAANARGAEAFSKKQYTEAAKAFEKQSALHQSPNASFNLGTSQIAAGNRELGSSTISKALQDPQLRGDAFFNRGNSALAAKAYDYAIHDFTEALRANPRDAAAKRNLEIALAQKQASQRPSSGARGDPSGQTPGPQPQRPQTGQRQEKAGNADADALLRSVQQQEQEELARMHRSRPDRVHVGW